RITRCRKTLAQGRIGQSFWLTWQTSRLSADLSAGFLDDPAKTWRDKGRQTMEWTAENQPSTFFAVCARLIGPEVKLTIEQHLDQMQSRMRDPRPRKRATTVSRQLTSVR